MERGKEDEIAEKIKNIAYLTEDDIAREGRGNLNTSLEYGPLILASEMRALDRDAPALIDRLNAAALAANTVYGRKLLLKTFGAALGAQYGLAEDLRAKYKPKLLDTLSQAALNDPSSEVRKTVIQILANNYSGADTDEKIAGLLAKMMADKDTEVIQSAAQKLAGRMEWHMIRTRENLWEKALRDVFNQRAAEQKLSAERVSEINSDMAAFMAQVQSRLSL